MAVWRIWVGVSDEPKWGRVSGRWAEVKEGWTGGESGR